MVRTSHHPVLPMPLITEVTAQHVDRWAEHLERIFLESGREGTPLFSPYETSPSASSPEGRSRYEKRFALPVKSPGWGRAWTIDDADGRAIAHLDLVGSVIPSEMHRATLGIGCERAFCRQGYGRAMMRHAVDFVVDNGIEWIDLHVFNENDVAIALYRSFGFVETGRSVDRFRLRGRSVDDVTMSLRVSPSQNAAAYGTNPRTEPRIRSGNTPDTTR